MWDTLILNPMINALLLIYSFLGQNFGLTIIIFTILVRLITYPLTAQQMKSTQAMQEMQKSKKWQDIQKKYKDNREKLAQEQMKLYQEMGVNPFGSCLPTLIQFPIIIGLYQAIIRALAVTPIQLLNLSRHVYPFINVAALIPLNNQFLWMDLSLPEKDFGLAIAGIGIPVLAILLANQINDSARHGWRPGCPNVSGNEPVHALVHGLSGLYLLFWISPLFCS